MKKVFSTLAIRHGSQAPRFLRPPFAPHRLGRAVSLVEPTSPREALERLRPPESAESQLFTFPKPLSKAMRDVLRTGQSPARGYKSRSEAIQAFVTGAARAGFPDVWILARLLDPGNAADAKVREISKRRGPRAAYKYVKHCIDKAYVFLANTPSRDRNPALATLDEIESAADARRWPGRGGATDRAVLEAFIKIGRRLGALRFRASVRELAILAGVASVATVARSLPRLRKTGFLRLTERSKSGSGVPSQFQLERSEWSVGEQSSHTTGGRDQECSDADLSPLANEIFRWGALGKSSWRVWHALRTPASEAEIAHRLGMRVKNIRRYVRRLAAFGLVTLDEAGRWRRVVDRGVLARAAEDLGTLGETQRQMERYEFERAKWLLRRSSRGGPLTVVKDEPRR